MGSHSAYLLISARVVKIAPPPLPAFRGESETPRTNYTCRDSKSCRRSLERYEQACSVDSETKTCAGTYTSCREAMVEILGDILHIW